MNAIDDRLLTRKQAAEVLGFQPQTLARWKWQGRPNRPPEVRIGERSVRYRSSELATWIAAQGDKATSRSDLERWGHGNAPVVGGA